MRKITAGEIAEAVRRLCVEANRELPAGLEKLVRESPARESSGTGRAILGDLAENLDAARQMAVPICQDTGMAVVFAQVGQEVCIEGDFDPSALMPAHILLSCRHFPP